MNDIPTIANFEYVDTAWGGAQNRNKIKRLDDFKPPSQANDVFTTYCRYLPDFVDYAQANPNVSKDKRPSVKGYDGPTFAPILPLDFDSSTDLELARSDALAALEILASDFDVDVGTIRIAFSGKKGFSLEIPGEHFGGFAPGLHTPARLQLLVASLFPGLQTLDRGIYTDHRLLRVTNTRHSGSKLFKIPLTLDELRELSIAEILELAKAPRIAESAPTEHIVANNQLGSMWAMTGVRLGDFQRRSGSFPLLGQRRLTEPQAYELLALLLPLWKVGHRHELALGLAGMFAKAGIAQQQAEDVMTRLSSDDAENHDRLRCVQDAYARFHAGRPVAGRSILCSFLDADVVDGLERLLPPRRGLRSRTTDQTALYRLSQGVSNVR